MNECLSEKEEPVCPSGSISLPVDGVGTNATEFCIGGQPGAAVGACGLSPLGLTAGSTETVILVVVMAAEAFPGSGGTHIADPAA